MSVLLPHMTFFLLYSYSMPITGIDLKIANLERTVTKVTFNDQDDNIYVGGRNFISLLSYDLYIIFKLDIGPVNEKEHCSPNLAPCDNTVTVLEFDKFSNGLLVCGTAYQGTCVLHNPLDFTEWTCVNAPQNQTTANRVSALTPGHTVVQILDTVNKSQKVDGIIPPGQNTGYYDCRNIQYGTMAFLNEPSAQEKNRSVRDKQKLTPNMRRTSNVSFPEIAGTLDPIAVRPGEVRLSFATRIMVASWTKPENRKILFGEHPIISLREMLQTDDAYQMSFSEGLNASNSGIHHKSNLDQDFDFRSKYGFVNGNFSYFLSLQTTTCDQNEREKCTLTILSRVNNTSPSVIPYMELPLKCTHEKTTYDLLLSSSVGKISSSYVEVKLLILAFGKESTPGSQRPDPTKKTAVCIFSVDFLDITFDNYVDMCNTGLDESVRPPSWIKGAGDECATNKANDYIRLPNGAISSTESLIHDGHVLSIFSHTPVFQDERGMRYNEIMNVYMAVEKGKIYKFGLEIKKQLNWYAAKFTSQPEFLCDISQEVIEPVPTFPGVTDHVRAVTYLAYGTQLVRLSLDFCRQYTQCSTCHQNSENRCRWCPAMYTCLEKEEFKFRCKEGHPNSCPPQLDDFNPKEVPVDGGSVLTLKGQHLGSPATGNVTVKVCDQLCDNVMPDMNVLECTVRPKCTECPDKCYLYVEVRQRESYGNTSSKVMSGNKQLTYVVPEVTSFTPPYGPLFGGNVALVDGKHLNVGTRRHLEVLGIKCTEIYSEVDEPMLMCRMEKAAVSLQGQCGPVALHIDSYVSVANNSKYCFMDDPKISRIQPAASLVRGGLTLTVTGSSLNSISNFQMQFTVTVPSGNVTKVEVFRNRCQGVSNTTMTCQTPQMDSVERHLSNLAFTTGYLEGSLVFLMANRVEVKTFTDRRFRIYPTPVFLGIPTNGRASFIYPQLKDKLYPIKGSKIPEWLKPGDISITVGETQCPVVNVTVDQILCNVTDVLEAFWEDFKAFQIAQKSASSPTRSRTTNQVSKGNDMTYYDTTTISPNESTGHHPNDTTSTHAASDSVTTSPAATVGPLQSVELQRENKTGYITNNSTRTYRKTFKGNDAVITVIRKGQKIFQNRVEIEIGNFNQILGYVNVGPLPNDIGNPTDENGPKESRINYILIGAIVGSVLLLILLSVVCVVCAVFCAKKKRQAMMSPYYMNDMGSSQPGSSESSVPTLYQILESELEPSRKAEINCLIISPDRLLLGKEIGSGNFGCVYEGMLAPKGKEAPLKVAVKTLQDPSSHVINLREFVKEALIMVGFEHPHVLGLVGLVEKEMGVPYVVLPYMGNGDLLTYVRDVRKTLSLYDVIEFGADICSGMAYLSSVKLVHRDLAARNCMLDNRFRAKVADFGLCRDIYEKGYYTSDNKKKLPIRWMAVESIERGAYSTKSDVWSMGVVLWELLSRGVTPYPGVDGWDIINFLGKRRLAPPYFCPDELYQLMMTCWAKDPEMRPTFDILQRELLLLMGKDPTRESMPQETIQKAKGLPLMSKSKQSLNSGDSKDDNRKFPQIVLTPGTPMTNMAEPKLQDIEIRKTKPTEQQLPSNGEKSSKVSLAHHKPVQNTIITIPACYNNRDVSKSAMASYLELVDNYEPAPKFSNPFHRSKKRRQKSESKKSGSRKERGSTRSIGDRMSNGSDRRSNPNEYTIPYESRGVNSLIARDSDNIDGPDVHVLGTVNSLVAGLKGVSNYFELEMNSQRSSVNSILDGRSSATSSLAMRSVPRYLEEHYIPGSRCSSAAISHASIASSDGDLTRDVSRSNSYERLSCGYIETEDEIPYYNSWKEPKIELKQDTREVRYSHCSENLDPETYPSYQPCQDFDAKDATHANNHNRMSDLEIEAAAVGHDKNETFVLPADLKEQHRENMTTL